MALPENYPVMVLSSQDSLIVIIELPELISDNFIHKTARKYIVGQLLNKICLKTKPTNSSVTLYIM